MSQDPSAGGLKEDDKLGGAGSRVPAFREQRGQGKRKDPRGAELRVKKVTELEGAQLPGFIPSLGSGKRFKMRGGWVLEEKPPLRKTTRTTAESGTRKNGPDCGPTGQLKTSPS